MAEKELREVSSRCCHTTPMWQRIHVWVLLFSLSVRPAGGGGERYDLQFFLSVLRRTSMNFSSNLSKPG